MEVKRLKNGELTTAEIRKLIKAHNVAESIKIPKGATRQTIVQVLEKAGYVIEHKKAELRPVSKNKVKKLKIIDQKKVEQTKPKPKTELEKQKDMERKQKKELVEKKKVREIKKQAIQQQKEIKKKVPKVEKKIIEKKDIKNKNISNSKAMKQSSKKEDEVRPAKRVRRNPAPVKKVEPTKEPEKNPDKIEGGTVAKKKKPKNPKKKKPKKFTISAIKQLGKMLVDQLESDEMNNIMGKDKWTDDDLDFQISEAVKNGGFLDDRGGDERFKQFYEGLTDEEEEEVNNRISDRVIEEGRKYWKQQRKKRKQTKKNPDKIEGGKIQVIVPSLKGVFESTPKKMYEVLRKKFPKTFKLKKGELEQFGDTVGEKQAGVETLTENIEETMKKMKRFKKYMETFKNLNKEVIEKYGKKTQTNFYDLIEDSFIPSAHQIFNVWFKNRVEFKNAGFEPHDITKTDEEDEDYIYSLKMNKKRREDFIDTMGGLFNITTDKIDVKFE